MFSPAKAIAASALVVIIGATLLIARPFDQEAGSVPGAETGAAPRPPVEFTASWRASTQVRAGTSDLADGVVRNTGSAWRFGATSEATDPRLRGTLTLAANNQNYGQGQQVWYQAFRIENEGGVWQQVPTASITYPDGAVTPTVGVLVGEGGYDGLIAVVEVQTERDSRFDVELQGYIIEGGLPPLPEPLISD